MTDKPTTCMTNGDSADLNNVQMSDDQDVIIEEQRSAELEEFVFNCMFSILACSFLTIFLLYGITKPLVSKPNTGL